MPRKGAQARGNEDDSQNFTDVEMRDLAIRAQQNPKVLKSKSI